MALNKISMALLLFISLIAVASSQGYMGTVTTGTGIVPPLTVGKGAISPAGVGCTLDSAKPDWKLVGGSEEFGDKAS